MFCGEYTCQLDRKGCVIIPKPYRTWLRTPKNEPAPSFAAFDTLRLYPNDRLSLYMNEMGRLIDFCGRKDMAPLLQLTENVGSTRVSRFGRVQIPKVLLHHYGLAAGMNLLLVGCGDYIEIRQLREYPIHTPALRRELDMQGDHVTELEALQVTDINLRHTGPVDPEELRPFQNLYSLAMTGCGLSDAGFVTAFPQLRSLRLADNHIRDFSPVSQLSSLGSLQVDGNPTASLACIQTLKRLEDVVAAGCQISEMPRLAADSGLRSLQMNGNRLADLRFLEEESQLTALYLNGNRIKDVGPLAGKQKLRFLHIASNDVGDISVLFTLPGLRGVNAAGNPLPAGELRRLSIHTILNTQPLKPLGTESYEKERQAFVIRHREGLQGDAFAELLFALTHVRRVEKAQCVEEDRYIAKANYPLRETRRAFGAVLRMENGWEKSRILAWAGAQGPLRVPATIDLEETMAPGRSGSLRFSVMPDGGISGPGEPYTIDRSEYIDLRVF